MVSSFSNHCDHVLSDAPRDTCLNEHDIIANSNKTIRKKPYVVSFSLCQFVGEIQIKAHPDKVKIIREAVLPSTKRKLINIFPWTSQFFQEVHSKFVINCGK